MSKSSKRFLTAAGFLVFSGLLPLNAQDYSRFALSMGGGVTTPLNPTGAYAGISGNFVIGAGYNMNKSNSDLR